MSQPKKDSEQIFSEAFELPKEERRLFLAAKCGKDVELRQQVEALLKAHDTSGVQFQSLPLDEMPGDRIDRYKLLERLGEGGWGVVWMAEQIEPIRRRVALKILKLGMDTKEFVARFESERQALALMDHPNIARVFDGGATGKGRPYFVMELVRGIRLTEYCDKNQLKTKERLELFINVCQAVQHAHQKGIIHRDLKPSNLLVTVNGGEVVPKVIDFGVAKAMDYRLTEKTLFTRFQSFVGTPVYTSPEQAEMSSVDVDTRSDVYSLGVLLYELVSGKTPFDSDELVKEGFAVMRKIISETDPPLPSVQLNSLAEADRTTIAERRSIEAEGLPKLLRGDLDWITMKCLEKNRSRRYETANALVADLERYLENKPILASPPSLIYRVRKFSKRNKLAVAVTLAVGLSLILGAVGSTQFALKARESELEQRQQKELAQMEAEKSEIMANYLQGMFKDIEPLMALGRDPQLLRAMLDFREARLTTDLVDYPQVREELINLLGNVEFALRDYESTNPSELSPVLEAKFAKLVSESLILDNAGSSQEALEKSVESLQIAETIYHPDHYVFPSIMARSGRFAFRAGEYDQAGKYFQRELELREQRLGKDSNRLIETLIWSARVYVSKVEFSKAEQSFKRAYDLEKKKSGSEITSDFSAIASELAGVYTKWGKPEEAAHWEKLAKIEVPK